MKNQIEYFLFLSLSHLFRFFGLKYARKFAAVIAILFYYVIPLRKNVVISNLQKAFPDYSLKEIKKIAFNSYKSFGISLIEILSLPAMNKEDITSLVKFENFDIVNKKYAEGKGLIIMTAHFGNWEIGAISFGINLNDVMFCIVQSQSNSLVNGWMNRERSKYGNKLIPLGVSIKNIYKELKQGKVIAIIGDQRGPEDGIRVNLFDIKSSVFAGPAALALKTGSPILMGLIVRQKDFSYSAFITEIKTDNLPEDENEKLIEISQRHTEYLEKYIRQYPEQWFWMHKRWKY